MSNLLQRVSDLNRKIANLKRNNYTSKLIEYKALIYVVAINISIIPKKYRGPLIDLFNLEPDEIDKLSEEKSKKYIDLLIDLEKELEKDQVNQSSINKL